MKTLNHCHNPRAAGISRTGVLSLVLLVAASVMALLLLGLRGEKSQAVPPAPVADIGDAVTYEDPNHHLRLAVPAGWTIDAPEAQGPSAMTLITFQPPNGTGGNTLAVWKHRPTPGLTSRRWAEQEVAAGARMGKRDGMVRPDSWSDLVVAGHPAASLITDFAADSGTFTIYHVYALANTTSMKFRFMIPAGEFKQVKPTVDSILASCTLN